MNGQEPHPQKIQSLENTVVTLLDILVPDYVHTLCLTNKTRGYAN